MRNYCTYHIKILLKLQDSCNIETITPTVLIVGPQKDKLLVEMQSHESPDSFTNRIIR